MKIACLGGIKWEGEKKVKKIKISNLKNKIDVPVHLGRGGERAKEGTRGTQRKSRSALGSRSRREPLLFLSGPYYYRGYLFAGGDDHSQVPSEIEYLLGFADLPSLSSLRGLATSR